MLREAAGKVAWVGRATVFLVGLTVMMALVAGIASTALGANGDFFRVGKSNVASAVSVLYKSGAGPALSLKVDRGAPMAVDSSAKVAKLNADRVDGREASSFAGAIHKHAGEDVTSGTVSEARVDPALTRDSEVMGTVKANDGPNSGLDADQLDGRDSGEFATDGELEAKSADVWGYVRANGGLVQNPSANILQVTHPATGEYCVVTSIDYSTYLSPQVTLAEPGSTKIASVGTGYGSSCNPLYSDTQTPIPVYIRTPGGAAADAEFSIFVPAPN